MGAPRPNLGRILATSVNQKEGTASKWSALNQFISLTGLRMPNNNRLNKLVDDMPRACTSKSTRPQHLALPAHSCPIPPESSRQRAGRQLFLHAIKESVPYCRTRLRGLSPGALHLHPRARGFVFKHPLFRTAVGKELGIKLGAQTKI